MKVIDFHNHYYPPEYLRALQEGSSTIKVTFDSENNPLLHYPGDYNVVVPGHRDIAFRETVLEKEKIDKQVLTFTSPGTHIEKNDFSIELAMLVNNMLARIKDEKSQCFTALATLPLNNPQA